MKTNFAVLVLLSLVAVVVSKSTCKFSEIVTPQSLATVSSVTLPTSVPPTTQPATAVPAPPTKTDTGKFSQIVTPQALATSASLKTETNSPGGLLPTGVTTLDVTIWYDHEQSGGTTSFFQNLLCPHIGTMLGTSFKMTFKPGLAGLDTTKTAKCMNGSVDCSLSKAHLCAAEILPDLKGSKDFYDFACCTINNGIDGLQKCCKDSNIEYAEMQTCINDPQTQNILQWLWIEALALFGNTVAAPAFIINTEFDEPTTLAVCEDFKGSVCQMYASSAIPAWCS